MSQTDQNPNEEKNIIEQIRNNVDSYQVNGDWEPDNGMYVADCNTLLKAIDNKDSEIKELKSQADQLAEALKPVFEAIKLSRNDLYKDKEKLKPIFHYERKEFLRLWHSYHAKHKIPYSHDDADKFFNSIALIFTEEKQS